MFNWFKRKKKETPSTPPTMEEANRILMSGEEFGSDLTACKLLDDDGNEISKMEFMKIATDKIMGKGLGPDNPLLKAVEARRVEYVNGVRRVVPLGQGIRVDFRPVDGWVQMYYNGVEQGPLFPGGVFTSANDFLKEYRAWLELQETQGD